MVPDGWKDIRLGDLLEFKNGLNTEKENYGHGVKFVNVIDVFKNDRLYEKNIMGAVKVSNKQLAEYSVRYGDILFNRTSETFDEIAMSSVYLDSKEITFGGFVIRGRKKTEELFPDYSVYCFQSWQVRKELIRRGQGAVRANIGQKDLYKVPVVIPPVLEQKKIAKILLAWDQAIEIVERLLSNSQLQKKSLMQQLLTGKKRLPGFVKDWKWLRSNELFKIVSKKNNAIDEELLAVTQDQSVLPRSRLERKVVMPSGSTKGYKLVVPGNFVISLRSFQGGLEYSEFRGLVSPAYTVLTPIKKVDDNFYRQYFKSHYFIGHLAVAVIGIRDGKQISYGDFSFLKVPFPPEDEQKAVASFLSAADREIETLQQKLEYLRQEKKALMQQLLTGKRRVSIEES